MMDGPHPIYRRQWRALVIGNRDKREVSKVLVEGHQIGQVEPAVQDRDGPISVAPDEWEV